MPLNLRWNFNQVKHAIKYKYVKGNPTGMCFQESLQFGALKYNENVRPTFGKVREVLGKVTVAQMETD